MLEDFLPRSIANFKKNFAGRKCAANYAKIHTRTMPINLAFVKSDINEFYKKYKLLR